MIWLTFRGNELVLRDEGRGLGLIQGGAELIEGLAPSEPLYIGTLNDVPCVTCEVSAQAALPEGWSALGLRSLWGNVDEMTYDLAGYATQLLYWRHTSSFCPVCGHQTEAMAGDWGRRCTNCGHTAYPHVTPAILALVHDGDRVLLTHKEGWGNRYSIIAGFVEPGETLEACVHREVYEEVGVELSEVTYRGNQAWPFPHQVMIGFTGSYASGDIVIEEKELDDARWFHVDELPELPSGMSLSRQLLDAWIASRRG